MKRKKIVLIGKSSSGKDTLRKNLLDAGFLPAISHTTRPIRPNEKDGVDYHFVTLEEFERLEAENFFIESQIFNVVGDQIWKYGKSYKAVEDSDVIIATVLGTSNMIAKTKREMFYIVEMQCRESTRLERSLSRGDDKKEVYRRLKADDVDFSIPRDFIADEILNSELNWTLENFIENFKRFPELY